MKIADLPIKENLIETKAPENPPIPEIYNPPENIVDMQENNENIAMKRLQDETEKDKVSGKWRRRKGIKRNLREIPKMLYEECGDDCDELDQSKRYKPGINSVLADLCHDIIKTHESAGQQPISEPAVQDVRVPCIPKTTAAVVQQSLEEAER